MALSTCVISGKLSQADNRPLEGAIVRWQVVNTPPYVLDGSTKVGVDWSVGENTSDHNGNFSFTVIQGVRLRVAIKRTQYDKTFTVPRTSTANLFDL